MIPIFMIECSDRLYKYVGCRGAQRADQIVWKGLAHSPGTLKVSEFVTQLRCLYRFCCRRYAVRCEPRWAKRHYDLETDEAIEDSSYRADTVKPGYERGEWFTVPGRIFRRPMKPLLKHTLVESQNALRTAGSSSDVRSYPRGTSAGGVILVALSPTTVPFGPRLKSV